MSQEHLDRLTAIDASFLHQEGPTSHMHVGGARRVRGAAAALHRGAGHAARAPSPRAALPPEARGAAAGTGRPLWIDDPSFSLEYHVRHTALPHPGSEEQLLLLAGRIFSQQLDRSKPLWEMWMVEGLDGRGLRAHHQDPSRAHRRDRGRRHRPGHLRPRPGPGRGPPPRRGVAAAPRADRGAAAGLGHDGPGAHRPAHGRRGRGAGHAPGRGPALGARRPSRGSARSRGRA